jgi:preprotein translocase subunit YajC
MPIPARPASTLAALGWSAVAFADGPAAGAPAAPGFDWTSLAFLAVIFGIFYLVVFRPQARERKRHEDLLAKLAKGDEVVTRSGVHGKVADVTDKTVALEVSKGVRITVDKISVARRASEPAPDA